MIERKILEKTIGAEKLSNWLIDCSKFPGFKKIQLVFTWKCTTHSYLSSVCGGFGEMGKRGVGGKSKRGGGG